MMGRFSGMLNMRTFARFPRDIQCFSFHFLDHCRSKQVLCDPGYSRCQSMHPWLLLCVLEYLLLKEFNMLMFLVHYNC